MVVLNNAPITPPDSPVQAASAILAPLSSQPGTSATIDIESWTVQALEALSVSPIARGTGGTPLSIPLDDHPFAHGDPASAGPGRSPRPKAAATSGRGSAAPGGDDGDGDGKPRLTVTFRHGEDAITPPRRPPSRRDSQARREALLKGNEGSRQRRRWENSRLADVPNVVAPLPADWQAHPTHPVQHVPYALAQFWDKGLRKRAEERMVSEAAALQRHQHVGFPGAELIGRVPRQLRDTAKRSPTVRGWVRVLEEPVRRFVAEEKMRLEREAGDDGDGDCDAGEDELDEEDEEIVFVGRNGSMRDGWKRARREVRDQAVETGVVFDSLGDDASAGFKRWLTHSISDYYGLHSRSATIGNPAKRVVYVGIRKLAPKQQLLQQPHCLLTSVPMPRPLWEFC